MLETIRVFKTSITNICINPLNKDREVIWTEVK